MARNLPLANDPDYASLRQAAEWYAVLGSEDASESQRNAWQQWLSQSPLHARAWAHVTSVGRRFELLRDSGDREAMEAGLKAARRTGGQRRRVLAGLASLGLVGWIGWRHTPLRQELLGRIVDYRTGTGQIREFELTDGTRIWLNTASALDVDYSPELRLLRLVAGEIHIETAADPRRRFVVETPHGRMRALGTRFNVRLHSRNSLLTVYQGAVELRRVSGDPVTVPSGKQLRFDATAAKLPQAALAASDGWTRGVLVADQMPLSELVAELARYRRGHLGVAPEIAGLPVIGTFPLRDPDASLAMLEQSLPVRVHRTMPWWIDLEPRQ